MPCSICEKWSKLQATRANHHTSGENSMTDELKFFIWLLEKYAYDKNLPTADVLREWEEKNLIQEIYDSYPPLPHRENRKRLRRHRAPFQDREAFVVKCRIKKKERNNTVFPKKELSCSFSQKHHLIEVPVF